MIDVCELLVKSCTAIKAKDLSVIAKVCSPDCLSRTTDVDHRLQIHEESK